MIEHMFLQDYLQHTQNTESPKLFHLWVAVSCVAACLGRRAWLQEGNGKTWPNLFVVLTGPPALRKGYSIRYGTDLLKDYTNVRFAPNDTGGQRQGLIAAMRAGDEDTGSDTGNTKGDAATFAKGLSDVSFDSVGSISGTSILDKLGTASFDLRDPRSMYIAASELNSILGENNTQMLTFLQEMWDGNDYTYTLRNSEYKLKDAVLNILGATTPTQIALAMPPQAIGGGFMSRIIFVYAEKVVGKIARPTLNAEAGIKVGNIFGRVFGEVAGAFTETREAADFVDKIYYRGIILKDTRFTHYVDRRHVHLKKVGMALAACRGKTQIEICDYRLADELLMLTEDKMPDALGEYGANKLSAAKQKMIEYIRNSNGPIPYVSLFQLMGRDMSQVEYKNAIHELLAARKISLKEAPGLGPVIIAVSETSAKVAKANMVMLKELLGEIE